VKALYIDSSAVMKLVTEETESQELQRVIAGDNPWGDSIKLTSSTLTKVEVIRASERLGWGADYGRPSFWTQCRSRHGICSACACCTSTTKHPAALELADAPEGHPSLKDARSQGVQVVTATTEAQGGQ